MSVVNIESLNIVLAASAQWRASKVTLELKRHTVVFKYKYKCIPTIVCKANAYWGCNSTLFISGLEEYNKVYVDSMIVV